MARKIVIIPSFASSHLLRCWIPNIIETINPDIIIINEGLFPEGPENKGHIDEEFKAKYCFKNTMLGFDFEETETIVRGIIKKYPNKIFWLQKTEYTLEDSNKCFLESISRCDITDFREGDIIFPLEPDAFLLETDNDLIKQEILRLKPGEGLKCVWRDFLETQYYCEAINEVSPKVRRFCYCFDNINNYKKAMDGFMSQNYPLLKYTDKFWVRHYPWFVSGKWKELRYGLIWRKDPQYWEDFENGLQTIRQRSIAIAKMKREGIDWKGYCRESVVLLRPTRQDEGRWAQLIDVEHPKSIQSHSNFIK